MIQYPLYSLSTQMQESADSRKRTKSISGINLPDMTSANRSAIGADLNAISHLIAQTQGEYVTKAELITREQVTANG